MWELLKQVLRLQVYPAFDGVAVVPHYLLLVVELDEEDTRHDVPVLVTVEVPLRVHYGVGLVQHVTHGLLLPVESLPHHLVGCERLPVFLTLVRLVILVGVEAQEGRVPAGSHSAVADAVGEPFPVGHGVHWHGPSFIYHVTMLGQLR